MGSLLEDSDEAHSPGENPLSPCLKSILTCLFLLRLGPCWPLLLPSPPLSPTPNQSHGMAMATEATVMVATTGPTATATGERRKGLRWLSQSLTPLLNPNLMDMDIARMATTGPMDIGAGERRKGLLSLIMDMDTAVATMAVTVADIGAEQAK